MDAPYPEALVTVPAQARQWAPIDAAAEHLGVSEKTVRRMISAGQIKGYRLGSRLLRLDLNELDQMLCPIPTRRGEGAAVNALRG